MTRSAWSGRSTSRQRAVSPGCGSGSPGRRSSRSRGALNGRPGTPWSPAPWSGACSCCPCSRPRRRGRACRLILRLSRVLPPPWRITTPRSWSTTKSGTIPISARPGVEKRIRSSTPTCSPMQLPPSVPRTRMRVSSWAGWPPPSKMARSTTMSRAFWSSSSRRAPLRTTMWLPRSRWASAPARKTATLL